MPSLLDNAQNVKRIVFDLVLDQVGKRTALPKPKTVLSEVVTSMARNHGTDCFLHPFMKFISELR